MCVRTHAQDTNGTMAKGLGRSAQACDILQRSFAICPATRATKRFTGGYEMP
jgi:hypothetical protein